MSNIVGYFNGHPITKVENPTKTYTGIHSTSLKYIPQLMHLPEGCYEIKGKEFKIEMPYKNSSWADEETKKEKSLIHSLRQPKSYLEKYIEFKGNNEYNNHLAMGLIKEEEPYIPDCSACGDGGCFHCEPWRFI